MPYRRAVSLATVPLVRLEDRHFNYIEALQTVGKLSIHQRRRLWTIERELNRRALAPKRQEDERYNGIQRQVVT